MVSIRFVAIALFAAVIISAVSASPLQDGQTAPAGGIFNFGRKIFDGIRNVGSSIAKRLPILSSIDAGEVGEFDTNIQSNNKPKANVEGAEQNQMQLSELVADDDEYEIADDEEGQGDENSVETTNEEQASDSAEIEFEEPETVADDVAQNENVEQNEAQAQTEEDAVQDRSLEGQDQPQVDEQQQPQEQQQEQQEQEQEQEQEQAAGQDQQNVQEQSTENQAQSGEVAQDGAQAVEEPQAVDQQQPAPVDEQNVAAEQNEQGNQQEVAVDEQQQAQHQQAPVAQNGQEVAVGA